MGAKIGLYSTREGNMVVSTGVGYFFVNADYWNWFISSEEFVAKEYQIDYDFGIFARAWMTVHPVSPIPCVRRMYRLPLSPKGYWYAPPKVISLPTEERRHDFVIPSGWQVETVLYVYPDKPDSDFVVYRDAFGGRFAVLGAYYMPLVMEDNNYWLCPEEYYALGNSINTNFQAFARAWMHYYPKSPIPCVVEGRLPAASERFTAPTAWYPFDKKNGLRVIPEGWSFVGHIYPAGDIRNE